jgi:hypothetical protein
MPPPSPQPIGKPNRQNSEAIWTGRRHYGPDPENCERLSWVPEVSPLRPGDGRMEVKTAQKGAKLGRFWSLWGQNQGSVFTDEYTGYFFKSFIPICL